MAKDHDAPQGEDDSRPSYYGSIGKGSDGLSLGIHVHPPLRSILSLGATGLLKARRVFLERTMPHGVGDSNTNGHVLDNSNGNCHRNSNSNSNSGSGSGSGSGSDNLHVFLTQNLGFPHLIEIMQLPAGIRNVYTIPFVWCYAAEKVVPGQLLKKLCSKGRVFFKCLSYGATDVEAQELMEKLPGAPCLADYEAWTTRLDVIQDHESWKESDETVEPEFDPELIRDRIRSMYDALYDDDHEQMRLSLQRSINRKLGGMDLPRLYKHCWFGTKHLIDDYVNAVRGTIEAYVAFLERPDTPLEEVRQGKAVLEEAFRSYGQTALCLSGGATLGLKHVGVVKCLWESFLLPRVLCGNSAGSIVASVVATTTDEDMRSVMERFPHSRLSVFYDGSPSGKSWWKWCYDRFLVFRNMSAFYDPRLLDDVLYYWLQDITFKEAYNKTRRILNVGVSRMENTEPTVLNYLTAPDVVIRTAVIASCAVPWIYPAARILEKKPGSKELVPWKGDADQMYVDGSLDHDIPTRVLGATWNAKYFIVSQVNPHVRFFLSPEEEFFGVPITTPYHYAGLVHSTKVLVLQALNTLIDSVDMVPIISDLRVWRYGTLLAQKYTGDVNIYPSVRMREFNWILKNPTPEYMLKSMVLGERATWPKMPRIKNCLAIEVALQKAISDLNLRLNLSPVAGERERRRRARETRPRTEARQPEFLKQRSLSSGWLSSRRGSIESSPGQSGHSRTKSEPLLEEKRAKSETHLSMAMTRLSDSRQQQQPRSPSPHAGAEERLWMTRMTEDGKRG